MATESLGFAASLLGKALMGVATDAIKSVDETITARVPEQATQAKALAGRADPMAISVTGAVSSAFVAGALASSRPKTAVMAGMSALGFGAYSYHLYASDQQKLNRELQLLGVDTERLRVAAQTAKGSGESAEELLEKAQEAVGRLQAVTQHDQNIAAFKKISEKLSQLQEGLDEMTTVDQADALSDICDEIFAVVNARLLGGNG